MKKVLFASNNLNIGGMEKSLVSLLNAFDFDKYDVTLLLENKKGILLNELNPKIKVEEYKLSYFRIAIVRKFINYTHRLFWKFKNNNKYDYSCCYATYSRLCNVLARIASNNNSLYVHSNYYEYFNHNKKQIKDLFDELNIDKFSSVVFVSNESKQGVLTVYPNLNDKFHVINNIFDYSKIDKLKDKKVSYKKSNKKVLLFVGRLEEESKRLTRLINAINIVKDFTQKFELLIVGGGVNEYDYKKMIKDKKLDKYIKMIGEKENPYPYYLLADYIILVSNFEGFPVIYNEAMHLRKPLLTTIDCSDDVVNIGKDAATILEKDPIAISKVIIDVINNKIEKKKINIDYNAINKNRINKIYELIEGENNEK